MGRTSRIATIVLLAALVLTIAAPLACAHGEGDPPILTITPMSGSIDEGGSATFSVTLTKEFLIWPLRDDSYFTCAIDPSSTAVYGDDYTISDLGGQYDDELTHTFAINTFEDSRYERENSTINVAITLHYRIYQWLVGYYTHEHVYRVSFKRVVNTTPSVFFAPDSYAIDETNGRVTLTLVRAGNRSCGLTVDYATADGNATDGVDYVGQSGTRTFGRGDSANKTITIDLADKYVNSDNQVFFYVNLSNLITDDPAGGVIEGHNATVYINQNAYVGTFSVRTLNNNNTIMENAGNVTFFVERRVQDNRWNKASDNASVNLSIAMVGSGYDYIGPFSTLPLVFNHTDRNKTVNVSIHASDGYDDRSHYMAQLVNPGPGASIDQNAYSREITILDSDAPPGVGFASSASNMSEGQNQTIRITKTGDATSVSGSVYLSIESGALPGGATCTLVSTGETFDPYEGIEITFSPTDAYQEVRVYVYYSSEADVYDTVRFRLQNPDHLRIDQGKVSLTIKNVKPPGPSSALFKFFYPSAIIDRGTSYNLTISRYQNTTVESGVSFQVNAVGSTAVQGRDYTLSKAPGTTIVFGPDKKTDETVQINVLSTQEGDRTLVLELVSPANAEIGAIPTITLTLRDLNPVVTPTPTPVPIDSSMLVLQVSVTPDTITPGSEAIVNVTVTDGTSPMTGANVTVRSSRGTLTPLASLNSNGKYFWRLKSDSPGLCILSITATATGYRPATASTTVQAVSAPVGSLGLGVAVSPDPVLAGADAQVAITVTADGRPLPGAMVNILGTGGSLDPPIGYTGPDGTFRAGFRADAVDTYILSITATATGHPAASGSYGVNVVEGASRHLYCTVYAQPQSVGPGGAADVTVMVTDGSGPVEGANVTLNLTGGSIGPSGGTTGADGTFKSRLVAGAAGTYTLSAQATAPDSVPAGASILVDARPGLIDAQLVILVLLAIGAGALLLAGAFLLVGRLREVSLKATPKVPYVQADGSSRLPIKVEAYDGFGRPKRMRRNTRVDLEATAGKIEDVIIPAGKSAADALLTSSRDFGTVTVTARLDDRAVASAPVEFRLENGSLAVSVSPSSLIADSKSSATITVRVRNGKGQYVSPLEDRAVELKTTLGDIIGSITTMPARAQSANARILSPGNAGTATVTATMGNLKGTGRVEFKDLPTRPCSQCGQPVANSATVCPWCGQDPRPAAAGPAPGAMARYN